MSATLVGSQASIPPSAIRPNPLNPRRYFNDEALDLLKTSLQEVGVLVPLIVYETTGEDAAERPYTLLDGERRWRCSGDLFFDEVPVNIIPVPDEVDGILRMFNIHSVREAWPLISVALSLREVINRREETRESKLAEWTGLPRATVRRAKRLLSLPESEITLIQEEAHLPRAKQVHREDLYLEILAAVSRIRNVFPEISERYGDDRLIREFVRKREEQYLVSVTEFRDVTKLIATADNSVPRERVAEALVALVENVDLIPSEVFEQTAKGAFQQQTVGRRAVLLSEKLRSISAEEITPELRRELSSLATEIQRLLAQELGDE
jgi:ParB/RepB/Spo0J family partition protein